MSAARECRRKHWRVWTTKTLGDGRQIVVCPLCGYEPTGQQQRQVGFWTDQGSNK